MAVFAQIMTSIMLVLGENLFKELFMFGMAAIFYFCAIQKFPQKTLWNEAVGVNKMIQQDELKNGRANLESCSHTNQSSYEDKPDNSVTSNEAKQMQEDEHEQELSNESFQGKHLSTSLTDDGSIPEQSSQNMKLIPNHGQTFTAPALSVNNLLLWRATIEDSKRYAILTVVDRETIMPKANDEQSPVTLQHKEKKQSEQQHKEKKSSEQQSDKRTKPQKPSISRNSQVAQQRARRSGTSVDENEAVACPKQKSGKTEPLSISTNSWVAQQRARRSGTCVNEDEAVVRAMKSILNKLTLEKFSQLYTKLLECGMRKDTHVKHLIREIFEKATLQHHFIDMYADLSVQLQEHFLQSPLCENPELSFKQLLLNECQVFFEANLEPPSDLASLDEEDRTIALARYKTRMLGNIKLIGALLLRGMLASKLILGICDELLQDPRSESLEMLAALLTMVGPRFDVANWKYCEELGCIFIQVEDIIKWRACDSRVGFLLRDVLDLRRSGWCDKKPKPRETPTTLEEVSRQAAAETRKRP